MLMIAAIFIKKRTYIRDICLMAEEMQHKRSNFSITRASAQWKGAGLDTEKFPESLEFSFWKNRKKNRQTGKIRIVFKNNSAWDVLYRLNRYCSRLFQICKWIISKIIVAIRLKRLFLRRLIASGPPIICLKEYSDVTFLLHQYKAID